MPQLVHRNASAVPGMAGALVGVGHKIGSGIAIGGVAQVDTVTVDAAVNDFDYTATITDAEGTATTATFNSGDGGLTTTQIATGLRDAINATGAFGAKLIATSAANVITLSGRFFDQTYTITSSANTTAANVNAAAAAESIPFGLGLIGSGVNGVRIPSATTMTANVWTLTPVVTDSTLYSVTVRFKDHQDLSYQADFTSGVGTTATLIVDGVLALIDAAVPADSVDASNSADTLVLTSEIPGIGIEVTVGEGLANWSVITETTANNLEQWAGVSQHTQHASIGDTVTQAVYLGGEVLPLVQTQRLFVRVDAGVSPALTDPVYVRLIATGTEQRGAFRNGLDAGDCFFLPGAKWTGTAFVGLDQFRVCELELNKIEAA